MESKHHTILQKIKDAIDRTHDELNFEHRYQEKHYQAVLCHYIHKSIPNVTVSYEVVVPYKTSDGFCYMHGRMDLVVQVDEFYIIIELKAGHGFCKRPAAIAQLKRYMSHAQSKHTVLGILVIFGGLLPSVTYMQKVDRLICVHQKIKNIKLFDDNTRK